VLVTPIGHAEKPIWLDTLGLSYAARYRHLGNLVDINSAIEYHSQAVSLTHAEHPRKLGRLYNLATSYRIRFQRLKHPDDIESAIDCLDQAYLFTRGENHDAFPLIMDALGRCHVNRTKLLCDPHAIRQAISCFQSAAESPTGSPLIRFKASIAWARLLLLKEDSSSLQAYRKTMELWPQVVWLGATVGRRYEDIEEFATVATEAAVAAITYQAYDLAFEWLEEGRSIVWNQMMQLRAPLDELFAVDPALADQLKQVASHLDQSEPLGTTGSPLLCTAHSLEQAAQQHRRLAEDWDRLLSEARRLPGFQDFLRPRKLAALAKAAEPNAVVALNIHSTRCDALLLLPNTATVAHVALDTFSYDAAVEARTHLFLSLKRGNIRTSRGSRQPVFFDLDNEDHFGNVLATLWVHVVKPVLNRLGYLVNICIQTFCLFL
jgi:hypothetical protein